MHRAVTPLFFPFVFALLSLATGSCRPDGSSADGPSFRIEIAPDAYEAVAELGLQTPITGRVFVIISRDEDREPRTRIGISGVPFWGKNVEGLEAGGAVTLAAGDDAVFGFPFNRLEEFPAGTYQVQAFLSVYTTFNRSDGHTVSLHLNSGAGQNQWRAPGNVYGPVERLTIDPAEGGTIDLRLDTVIPPIEPLAEGDVLQQGNPQDSERVKFVKIRSEKLSEFWGHPMYIGANVLLPADYDAYPDRRYPVLYMQGHFPGRRAPLGFSESGGGRGRGAGLSEFWLSDQAPRMIAVSIRDANPYYDTSYSVNSENVGPYGDAITEELIPHLEQQFRIIPERWARTLAGGSTGGWEALAMQVFYPGFFGGSWGWCPDPVDFNYYQIVNVYEDQNAYFLDDGWHRVERPNTRRTDGNVTTTVRQENHMEYATGTNSRSGGQWAIWEAVFGPVGEDGYPRPIWDPVTGDIDSETAAYWKEHYDIHQRLRSNWESVAPDLDGMLHVAVGDMDTYYLDNAVYLLEDFLDGATGPRIEAEFQYGRRKPHCWTGYSPSGSGEDMTTVEFVRVVADHLRGNAPVGADLRWYRP